MSQIPTVEDFEVLANPNGQVPMRFLQETITERIGDIRGAAPALALRYYNMGLAEPLHGLKISRRAEVVETIEAAPTVDVPDDWRNEHVLSRIALAKRISGKREKLTADEADNIIQAYLSGETGNITLPTPTAVPSGQVGPNAVTSTTVLPHV